jgi:hypothetical protein
MHRYLKEFEYGNQHFIDREHARGVKKVKTF